MKLRIVLAALLASLPLVVFVMLTFVGIGSISLATLLVGLSLGVPFWLLVVLPVYLLSGKGRRWSIWITIAGSFIAVAALYVISFWTPDAYTLAVGGKVLVQKGVATRAYYEDLWAHVAAAAVAVLLGAPIFARLVRER
jgi:hypothetical protein